MFRKIICTAFICLICFHLHVAMAVEEAFAPNDKPKDQKQHQMVIAIQEYREWGNVSRSFPEEDTIPHLKMGKNMVTNSEKDNNLEC